MKQCGGPTPLDCVQQFEGRNVQAGDAAKMVECLNSYAAELPGEEIADGPYEDNWPGDAEDQCEQQ